MKNKQPDEFKAFYNNLIADYTNTYRRLLDTQALSERTKAFLRNNYKVMYAMYLFEYEMDYNRRHDEKLPLAFYDFLQDIPMDDQTLLSSPDFMVFINRLEYCAPFNVNVERSTPEEIALERWQLKDSVYTQVLKLKPGIIYDITKVRSLDSSFKNLLKNNKAAAERFLAAMTSGIRESFLNSEADRLFRKNFPEEKRTAYALPDTKEARIFKKIIEPFKGKILHVDFWATTCSPCLYNIKNHKGIREKYKESPDVDFIFITAEDISPLAAYNRFVEEQNLLHSFRLTADDYLHLRQLFRFNGIPHYIIVDREGRILNDDASSYQLEEDLNEILYNTTFVP
ncbi:MAG: TlpA family protein disulfide reductase [Dysgonamonadaceae bacterium]|jgi:hypothetical protein|nr:TlpA family protein disulfide reductase [Dysgonamonadaceae bacterium]